MKRATAIFLLLSFVAAAFAGPKQKADSSKAKFPCVDLGVNFSNDIAKAFEIVYGDPNLANPKGPGWYNWLRYGYTVSLNAQINLTQNCSVETGIQFANKGYEMQLTEIGNYSFDPTILSYCYNFYYLSVPLKVNYIIGKKRVRFIASVGGAIDVAINNTDKRIFYQDYRKVNFTPFVSAGIDYKFLEHFHLRVEPTFRYSTLPFSDYPFYTARLWSVGLNTGFYYAF